MYKASDATEDFHRHPKNETEEDQDHRHPVTRPTQKRCFRATQLGHFIPISLINNDEHQIDVATVIMVDSIGTHLGSSAILIFASFVSD
jgi:hypothetical protein